MAGLLNPKLNLGSIVNPFYIYCLAFSLAISMYLWGWSNIFPSLSAGLILFFLFSFLLFFVGGYKFGKREIGLRSPDLTNPFLNDIIFGLIVILGIINILLMGYLPLFDRSHNYREFGAPVIDPLFNTLSIFFSVFFVHTFLNARKKRYLLYIVLILLFQILIFRRSTIVWIITSSTFLFLVYYKRISIILILTFILSIPLLSYSFGLYGNYRSELSESLIINELGASASFKNTDLSHNHYITYLYVSSPLANLQKNIDEGKGLFNNGDLKNFLFYSIIPESITMRTDKVLKLKTPECSLITPNLIAGSFLMVSFFTMGWPGMVFMLMILFAFILLCLYISERWNIFQITTLCILSTTVSLLIFSNFLNRLDVLLMLFIYPVGFHLLYSKGRSEVKSVSAG